ncbi:MAG: AMP-binding protein, partial [Spirochaetales bacterium]|nr:AMP-binding protein [Spirochaetales bacterium]
MESSLINSKKYYNLSEPQKMIYWGEFLHPKSSLNTVCVTYELEDQNDVELLKKVIVNVIKENPGLHLRIHNFQGIPYQYKCDDESYTIQLIDFSNETNNKKEIEWIEEKATYSFNFFDSRLFNFYLYKSFDSSTNMMIQLHHIISDAWTHQSLSEQIFSKYKSLNNKEEDVFKPKYSYLEYINTEKEFLNSTRAEKCLEFWKDKFRKTKEIPLYTNTLHKKTRSNAERYRKYIDDNLQKKIQNITTNNKISLPTFFLGCLLITLQKLYKMDTHYLGTLTYNRLGKQEKEAVGMFVNTLPMYFNLDNAITFRSLSQLIDIELMGIMRNQRFPLSKISNSEELKDLDLAKKIQIIYSFQSALAAYNYIFQDNKSTNYPILFRPTREGLDGKFHIDIDYQIDCFSEGEIKNIADVFLSVIEDLEDVDAPIDYKNEFNLPFTKKNYNLDRTLHSIFEDKVNEFPDNIAISFGEESLTYYELNRRANFLAKELLKKGCKAEDPVVLVLNRSLEMMISILAVLKAGGCYLPMSPEQPLSRIKKIVELSGSEIIIYNNKLNEEEFNHCTFFNVQNLEYPIRDFVNPNVEVKPENLAYIIYTSGSTGEPKGVMIEHKAVINRLLWMQDSYPLNSSDKLLQKTPYTFDVSVWELFWWYFNGSSLHFLKPGGEKEPEVIAKTIEKEDISVIHFVPSMLSLFLEYIERFSSGEKFKTLKRVICSGEALNLNQVEKFTQLLSKSCNTSIHNLYGPTEAAIDVSFYECTGKEKTLIPIGKPIDNVELYVMDKDGNVLPAGESGELFIGG